MKINYFKTTKKRAWFLALPVLLALVVNAPARTIPDASDPVGFFTTVADKLLRSTFPFGVTNIPVCSNGVYVYTPAVQRLLQLSANLYDAANTNFFPVVFRPLFANDAAGNLFIIGYQQVTNVSGPTDPQLSPPYDVTQLSAFDVTPIADAYGPVNVYGVPWIIGAKKGLPNFNQLSLVNAVQVTRKLQVTRTSPDISTAIYATNQMYVMGISNSLGISFWNSYNSNYPNPLTICAHDTLYEALTNGVNTWAGWTNFTLATTITQWPGSQWSSIPPNATPKLASFLTNNWSFNFLNPAVYRFGNGTFDESSNGTNVWETTVPPLPPLPHFGLNTTNYLQAFILDGSNVIDYVQLRDPISNGNLNQALADPDYPNGTQIHYQWSTNAYPVAPAGVMNQLDVSGHPNDAPFGGIWVRPDGMPASLGSTPAAEAAFFSGFFYPDSRFQYNGQTYTNTNLVIEVPYTPTRVIYSCYLLQANDPLVHYLASDLGSQVGVAGIWANKNIWSNGTWYKSDSLQSQTLPQPPITSIGGRYQPWGQNRQMMVIASVDTNGFNLAYKDPLVWGPDNWAFPTNLLSSLGGLGQVHRGTPWQTVYLKSANTLKAPNAAGYDAGYGTNTWANWTGNLLWHANYGQPFGYAQYLDAALMAPVADWRLAGLLMSLLNTNDPTQLFSVNDPNLADWQNVLNGLTVYSNSVANPKPIFAPTFDTYVLASNSPQASVVANGIANVKAGQSNQNFYSIGDLLAAPELTVISPWLNTANVNQQKYGITDAEYEAIPAQLLPRLRSDSIGTLAATKGGWILGFSGADGYAYVLQTSTDLVNWEAVSTNYPVQSSFTLPITSATNSPNRFYRSVLLP